MNLENNALFALYTYIYLKHCEEQGYSPIDFVDWARWCINQMKKNGVILG